MTFTLKQIEKPNNTPLAALIVQAQAELVQSGFSDGSDSVDWTCNALYAEQDGVILGLLCWKVSEWMQEAQITLGYVRPEYRGQGIYTRLFAALEAEAIKQKLRSITGYTDVKNVLLQSVAVNQGRELFSLGYRKRLPLAADTLDEPVHPAHAKVYPLDGGISAQ